MKNNCNKLFPRNSAEQIPLKHEAFFQLNKNRFVVSRKKTHKLFIGNNRHH